MRSASASTSSSCALTTSPTLIAVIRPLSGFFGRYFLSMAEERQPLVVVFFLRRPAAGGVEHDGFVGQPPVAVARAAEALDRAPPPPRRVRELQARVAQRRALAGAGRADDRVPGQQVQRVAPVARRACCPSRRATALSNSSCICWTSICRSGRTTRDLLFGLLRQRFFQAARRALRAPGAER